MNEDNIRIKWQELWKLHKSLTKEERKEIFHAFLQQPDQKLTDWTEIFHIQQEQNTYVSIAIAEMILWFTFLFGSVLFVVVWMHKILPLQFLVWLYVLFLIILFFILLMITEYSNDYGTTYYHRIQKELKNQQELYEELITSSPLRFLDMLEKYHEIMKIVREKSSTEKLKSSDEEAKSSDAIGPQSDSSFDKSMDNPFAGEIAGLKKDTQTGPSTSVCDHEKCEADNCDKVCPDNEINATCEFCVTSQKGKKKERKKSIYESSSGSTSDISFTRLEESKGKRDPYKLYQRKNRKKRSKRNNPREGSYYY